MSDTSNCDVSKRKSLSEKSSLVQVFAGVVKVLSFLAVVNTFSMTFKSKVDFIPFALIFANSEGQLTF